ncbi:MAG: insulinase family protein [Lachnospiraceae bacterium]|nr:insulinase family protein [Lachnospiraceae bacterium]
MKFEAYEFVEEHFSKDLNGTCMLLRHKKTGARVALVSNDDENKVFYIGFRTPSLDSTGAAHIVEHTVLCGSEHFPVKDPFIELTKGSLNTFLNAMTYPDKTVYPVASCNDRDFQNLMHVYLDAVFHPNIYKEEKIFRQEGWHYEMESMDAPLTINGVVYNEMKGAYSSPDDVFDRQIVGTLFPETSYQYESGGDPEVIPTLTYEQYLKFHSLYYHPSNCYIYLYGDMDMEEKLAFIDREYLSGYEKLDLDTTLKQQPAFTEFREVSAPYPVADDDSLEDNTYLSYNVVVGGALDAKRSIAFDVLDYALCSAPGAPIKQSLIQQGIGKDVYGGYNDGLRQPYFNIVAKNANADQKEAFVSTIEKILRQQAEEGIDKEALLAAINYYEFKFREADFGSFPKGLIYGLDMLDSWIYDDLKPFIHVEAGDNFKALRKEVETGYFEQLIKDNLLDNPHGAVVILTPEHGLTKKKEDKLAADLSAYKESLSDAEKQKIIDETRALKEYQESEDDPEALKTIPLLSVGDIRREVEDVRNEVTEVDGVKILHHPYFTNGIGYIQVHFDARNVPEELFGYLGIFKNCVGMMDTEHYSYGELFNKIHLLTGGVYDSFSLLSDSKEKGRFYHYYQVKAKALEPNIHDAFTLIRELIFRTKFDDTGRLLEILQEMKSHMEADMLSSGHVIAAARAISYMTPEGAISEYTTGMDYYYRVADLIAHYEERKDDLVNKLYAIRKVLLQKQNLFVDYTGEKADGKLPQVIVDETRGLFEELYPDTEPLKQKFIPEISKKQEGFMNSSQVLYVALAGDYSKKGLTFTGALRVLKILMSYDYLWNNVRVKGGAYDCMCKFGKNGECVFASYRDPELKKTLEVYRHAAEYIRNVKLSEREITQYIIGTISSMDTPKTPAIKGSYSQNVYLTRQTVEELQKERDQVLSVTEETIHSLADYIDAFVSDDYICVTGNESKLKEEGDELNLRPMFATQEDK